MFPCEFRFWVSWHVDELVGWAAQRPGPELWGVREWPGVRCAPVLHLYGSSAMNAVQLALTAWGFARVVLAGIRLEGLYDGYRSAWWPLKTSYHGRIKGFGPFAEQTFGRPSAAFVGA